MINEVNYWKFYATLKGIYKNMFLNALTVYANIEKGNEPIFLDDKLTISYYLNLLLIHVLGFILQKFEFICKFSLDFGDQFKLAKRYSVFYTECLFLNTETVKNIFLYLNIIFLFLHWQTLFLSRYYDAIYESLR